MMGPLRVGVVGFGYWGPNLVRNIAKSTETELIVICDGSSVNLEKAKSAYPDVLVCGDVEQMLSEHQIDAVVVASSVPSHFAVARSVILAGKHCFVEKPLTLNSADAEELVRLAAEKDVVLLVDHLLIYHAAVREIKRIIESGELGEVLYLYAQRLNLGKVRTAENAFWSLAPHNVSIALYLLGEEADALSATGSDYLNKGIQDVIFASLHFPSGKSAHIHVSWLDPHKVRKFTIVGTKKMLVFDDMDPDNKIWIYDKGVGAPDSAMAYGEDLSLRFGEIRIPALKMREPLADVLSHFVSCCRGDAQPESDGVAGLAVVRVLEAVDGSIEQGGTPVQLKRGVGDV
jgi:predicted dehydrogenase